MKKILAVALSLVLSFSLAACGSSAQEPQGEGNQTNGTLKVAVSPDFAPMEFVDLSKSGDDKYVGFDITLAKYIAEELGMQLQIMPMSFDACQIAVQTGNVDMSISGFSWTEERAENYNLSDYYHAGDNETEQTVIALAENKDKFTSAESFAGVKVGAQAASLQESLVKEQLVAQGAELVTVGDINTGILQLKKGDFDAMAVATGNGEAIVANNPEIAMTGFIFEIDPKYVDNLILIQKGNDELTDKVNAALAKANAAGYYETWYEEAQALAGVETAGEVSFDDNGNEVTE